MEKVAEHINEMQRIHEEYGAIFDHLFRQHQKSSKQVSREREKENISVEICKYLSCSQLISPLGTFSTTEVWSGSTSQISWEKLKRYQYHHITSVSPSSVSNNRKISEIDTFSTPHNFVCEKEELMFDLLSHDSDLTSSNVRPLVRKLCHLNYSFLSVIILSAS